MIDNIIHWYCTNKRELPWRKTIDPYKIWVSEIILQQTRVNQGLNYYYRFIDKFPSIEDLANADQNEVLLAWQSLGYYSRARNMHKAAQQIMNDFGGSFPETYEELITLKGVGDYTAAAVASFAFNKPYPAIDGNVSRVIARLYGVFEEVNTSTGKKQVVEISKNLIPVDNPSTYNQAMMEMGALVCLPKNPNCEECPVKTFCYAFKNNLQTELPKKKSKKPPKTIIMNFLVIHNEKTNTVIMEKRTESKGIWKNLYQFPLYISDSVITIKELIVLPFFESLLSKKEYSINPKPIFIKHQLTHQTLEAYFWIINTDHFITNDSQVAVNYNENINQYPIPRLIERFIEKKEKYFKI